METFKITHLDWERGTLQPLVAKISITPTKGIGRPASCSCSWPSNFKQFWDFVVGILSVLIWRTGKNLFFCSHQFWLSRVMLDSPGLLLYHWAQLQFNKLKLSQTSETAPSTGYSSWFRLNHRLWGRSRGHVTLTQTTGLNCSSDNDRASAHWIYK